MKKTNQEIDNVEAILAMRTMLSLNNAHAHKLEMRDYVNVEVIDYNCIEKSMKKPSALQ
jgi:hypothetical protein